MEPNLKLTEKITVAMTGLSLIVTAFALGRVIALDVQAP